MNEDFNDLLDKFRNDRSPLTLDLLSEISDMNRARRELFEKIWLQVGVARRRDIVKAMVELAEKDIEFDFNTVLRLSLEDEDAEIRTQAIHGLWEDEDPSLVGPLLYMLRNDQEEQVREQATESLGRFLLLGELGNLDNSRAFAIQETLVETYNNSQESITLRCRALESLAYSSDEVIHDLIEGAYYGEDERLTLRALFAMGRSADSRWQTIVMGELENANPEFRYEAAQACGKLELVEAVHTLGEIAQTDPDREVRGMTIWALGQVGDVEARRIINTMWDQQAEEGEEDEFIRDALAGVQEELAFREDVLDMSFSGYDWKGEWADDEGEFDYDEDNGSDIHDH